MQSVSSAERIAEYLDVCRDLFKLVMIKGKPVLAPAMRMKGSEFTSGAMLIDKLNALAWHSVS